MRSIRQARLAIPRTATARFNGFTLVELLVSITITIFLLGGILSIVQKTGRSATTQSTSTADQDNVRLALTILTDQIQQAGYFPDPGSYSPAAHFMAYDGSGALDWSFSTPVLPPYPVQTVYGSGAWTWPPITALPATSDKLSVRFVTYTGDSTLNCLGGTNTSGSSTIPLTYINLFQIDPNTGDFTCTVRTLSRTLNVYTVVSTSAPGVLIPGNTPNSVQAFQVLYGVKTNAAAPGNAADSYLDATQMAGNWFNVVSVMIKVAFLNPVTPNGLPLVQYTRVVNLMNQTGVTL